MMIDPAIRHSDFVPWRFNDVTIDFSDRSGASSPNRVVDGVTLEGRHREFVVLIGPSGCGKTTMLNAMAGLIQPTSGDIEVLGETPLDARSRTGYMFARDSLMPWRTALRNAELAMEIRGVPRRERRDRAEHYLELVGLQDARHRYPWQLSQGMRQRVALARTWAADPEMILMDEPFSALDAQTRHTVREEFLRIWDTAQRTVVFVTHDLQEAILLADRLILMDHGRVQLDVRVDFERPRDLRTLVNDERYTALHDEAIRLLTRAPADRDDKAENDGVLASNWKDSAQ
jgi:NitT/TauT family transport system ATP-binding protein